MSPRQVIQRFSIGIVFLALAADAHSSEQGATPPVGLVSGDYEMTVDATSGTKTGQQSKGRLFLRRFDTTNQLLAGKYRFFGWTDVDFKRLGAPIGASDTPPESKDPEHPGVLVLIPPLGVNSRALAAVSGISQPSGAPIMLIGTVKNRMPSQRATDGGGIGMFVQSKDGQCVEGEWTNWGIVVNGRGRFKVCPRAFADEEVAPASAKSPK